MKLENEFTVPASIDEAWAVLLDVPRVAPCLPGATVEEGEDGEYTGQMKIKIGPITASYKGTVKIQEADEANRTVAMRAQAKDARGQGTASATITSTMQEVADGTKVTVVTDMRVTGPAAQFGRGVMQDVSAKLMRRFADCLAEQMQSTPAAETTTEPEAVAAPARTPAPGAPPPAPPPAPGTPRAPPARPSPAAAASAPAAEQETPGASSGVSSAAAAPPPSASSGTSSAAATPPPSASSGTSTATPKPAAAPRPTDDVLDLGEASRDAVLKRVAPAAAAALVLLILFRLIRR